MNQPTDLPTRDRITELDMLHGFVLMGIFLSIVHGFNYSVPYDGPIFSRFYQLDIFIDNLNMVLISNRFISIFSMLFGIGIAIQEQRFLSRGAGFGSYFIRRMFILALFGLINTAFFFWGEILLAYSVFGTLVYLLSRFLNWKVLIGIALGWFMAFHPVFELFFKDLLISKFYFFMEEYPFDVVVDTYRSGSFLEMIRLRWIEYWILYTINSFSMGLSFALILCGYAIGKKQWHLWFIENPSRVKKLFNFVFIYSVNFAVYAIVTGNVSFGFRSGVPFALYVLFLFSSLFSYIYLISSMSSHSKLTLWLCNNGRLSLTGCLGAACIYSFIFHNNGLGLYLEYQAAGQMVIAVAVYGLFTVFSSLWLTKYTYGPLEWVYRKMSYRKI